MAVKRRDLNAEENSHRAGRATRRTFIAQAVGTWAVGGALGWELGRPPQASAKAESSVNENPFRLQEAVASCMYGEASLESICREMKRMNVQALDVWPRVHGNQREQIDAMGEEAFAELLQQHGLHLACLTQYPLGPFGLDDEMAFAERLGCSLLVTGARGPTGLEGPELKSAIGDFVKRLEPHLAMAERHGCVIAIENHGRSLIESPDSIRWLAEAAEDRPLGIALAPYHLPQDEQLLAGLIREIGPSLKMFYAWQHGKGCMEKLPKADEMLQLPGRGALDFGPLVQALQDTEYQGLTEVFMHPVPRGIPILPTAAEVTAEIQRGSRYLHELIRRP